MSDKKDGATRGNEQPQGKNTSDHRQNGHPEDSAEPQGTQGENEQNGKPIFGPKRSRGRGHDGYPCGENPTGGVEIDRWFYFADEKTPLLLKIKKQFPDENGGWELTPNGKPRKFYPVYRWRPLDSDACWCDGNMRHWELKFSKHVKKILYNLDTIKKAAIPGAEHFLLPLGPSKSDIKFGPRIIITEGEKDADNVFDLKIGIPTCSILGAVKINGSGWEASYNQYLAGHEIILVEDNDLAGRVHVQAVGRKLKGVASKLSVINFRAFGKHSEDGFDLSDFIEMRRKEGKTNDAIADELLGMAKDWEVEPTILSREDHMRSAREFVEWKYMEGDTRSLHRHRSVFSEWGGSCYQEINVEGVSSGIWEFLEQAVVLKKEGQNFKAVPFAPNKNIVANVLDALKSQCRLSDQVETPAWLDDCCETPANEFVAVGNGLLHLPTRTLHEPTPKFFNLNASHVMFDPNARCPAWEAFLREVLEDDDAIELAQEWVGYVLSPDTSQQKIFLAIGPKRSGKGTFARVLHELLGSTNCIGPTMSSLSSGRFALEPWIGKSLATISDARIGAKSDKTAIVERLLAISGEDDLTVERKFIPGGWTGKLPTRVMILTNLPPVLTDAASALVGRYLMVQFKHSFYGKEDHTLSAKLKKELPGILNWALDGYARLIDRGHFVQPKQSEQKLLEIEKLSAPVKSFIEDYCVLETTASVPLDALYDAWAQWCSKNGNSRIGSREWFARDLNAAEPSLTASRENGVRTYHGITLNDVGKNAAKWIAPKSDKQAESGDG